MKQLWRLIVFTQPPIWAAMRLAKSGKCWFRLFESREAVLPISRKLKLAGFAYLCDKVEKQPFVPRHSSPGNNPLADLRQGGFGGRLNATPSKTDWRLRKPKR